MEEISIDIDALRRDLIDYFGSATPMNQFAFVDVIEIENASDYEIVQIALKNGFDLEDYEDYSLNK